MQYVLQKVLGGRRITMPEEATDKLGIRVGDYVILEASETEIKIRPVEIVLRNQKSKQV